MAKLEIKNLKKRHAKEARFKFFGQLAIAFSLAFLVILFAMILSKSAPAFLQTKIAVTVDLSDESIVRNSENDQLNYRRLVKQSLQQQFPDTSSLVETAALYQMISKIAPL